MLRCEISQSEGSIRYLLPQLYLGFAKNKVIFLELLHFGLQITSLLLNILILLIDRGIILVQRIELPIFLIDQALSLSQLLFKIDAGHINLTV